MTGTGSNEPPARFPCYSVKKNYFLILTPTGVNILDTAYRSPDITCEEFVL
jgi:hypothetical protein